MSLLNSFTHRYPFNQQNETLDMLRLLIFSNKFTCNFPQLTGHMAALHLPSTHQRICQIKKQPPSLWYPKHLLQSNLSTQYSDRGPVSIQALSKNICHKHRTTSQKGSSISAIPATWTLFYRYFLASWIYRAVQAATTSHCSLRSLETLTTSKIL